MSVTPMVTPERCGCRTLKGRPGISATSRSPIRGKRNSPYFRWRRSICCFIKRQSQEFCMKNKVSRRSFMKGSAFAAGVFAAAPFNILHAANSGDKVRFVQIGCGGRGFSHLGATVNEKFVAAVDVDEKRHAEVKKWAQGKGVEAD